MKQMKSIWYFVGLVLLSMGSIILATGIYILITSTESHTVLWQLYPNIWWGGLMVLAGIIFLLIKN